MKSKRVLKIFLYVIVGLIAILVGAYIISPDRKNLERIKQAMDIDNEVTRGFALSLAAQYPGEYSIDQVCRIYEYLYKNWKYVSDPRGQEYFANASNSIINDLSGDCDDFAILMATMLESIGGKTRISFAHGPEGGHAFAEVYFLEDPQVMYDKINYHFQGILEVIFGIAKVDEVNYMPDSKGGIWINLDYSSKYPGGPYFKYDSKTIYYPRDYYFEVE